MSKLVSHKYPSAVSSTLEETINRKHVRQKIGKKQAFMHLQWMCSDQASSVSWLGKIERNMMALAFSRINVWNIQ